MNNDEKFKPNVKASLNDIDNFALSAYFQILLVVHTRLFN